MHVEGNTPSLEMRGISKRFPGVKALDNVNFKAYPGELLALMGENGAGKSTLMKVLSGVIPYGQYEGSVWVNGREAQFYDTLQARAHGVAIIHQELNLFPDMTVAENMFLTMEPLRSKVTRVVDVRLRSRWARERLLAMGVDIDVDRSLRNYSVGTQQLVEIARALATNANVLVLDEPTSALSLAESETLFRILGELKAQGKTLIYISHRMEEVFRLADRVQVLRDGSSVGGGAIAEMNPDKVIGLMVGRAITDLYPTHQSQVGTAMLRVEKLSVKARGPHSPQVREVSFEVRAGEILGVAGLVGSGRSELLQALFGAVAPSRVSGKVWVQGREVRSRTPQEAIRSGLALVTEDRKLSGLLLDRSVAENITLAALPSISRLQMVNRLRHDELVRDYSKTLRIKAANPKVEVRTLSGGNQQKIVLAKWLATQPKVLFLDEPTRGIDVGARQEIYQLIQMLADQGVAIVMVSSDLPEVLGMSDRVMVMRDGRLTGVLSHAEATQEAVMHLAAGM